jgi:PAS domain S-box-containing protein
MLAAIVQSCEDAIIATTPKGQIFAWNNAAERLFGYASDEMIGQSILKIIPPDRVREERDILRQVSRGKQFTRYRTMRVDRKGRPVEVSLTVSAIRNAAGKIIGISKIARDVSEQRRWEDALRESEQRMRAIVDTAVDAIVTIDERGRIESANAATQGLFGYTLEEMIGRNIKMLMPAPYHSEHDNYLRNYLRTGEARIIGIGREVIAMRKDRTTFPINLSVSEVRFGGRRLFTGIIHDISKRRSLERQILEISEAEQRRIGQDLHDGLCQYLVGIGFTAEMIAARVQEHVPQQAEEIRKVGQLMRNAATQARDLSHGLNPVGIGEQGLVTALQTLARQISELFQVACTFRSSGRVDVRDRATAMHIYRITQEAVSNAVRHGHSQAINVQFKSKNSYLLLTIEDNGRGMTTGGPSGMGLQTMGYRARMIGGTLSVGPRPGGGTVITCRIPQAT